MNVKPMSLFFAVLILCLLALSPFTPVWAGTESQQSTSTTQALEGQSPAAAPTTVNISSGLPVVTTQQAIAKSQRVTGQVYELIRNVAPHLVLIAICIAAVLSIFWRPARVSILVILLGYTIIEWGPQLVSWFQGLLHA